MCQFGPVKWPWGLRRGHSLTPLPRCFRHRKLFSTNRMHCNDLKGCMQKCSVPFRSKHFDAFWHFLLFLGHYIHILHIINQTEISILCFITLMFKSNCMQKRFKKEFLALLVNDPSSLCDILLSVVRPSVCLSVCLSVSLSVNNILFRYLLRNFIP